MIILQNFIIFSVFTFLLYVSIEWSKALYKIYQTSKYSPAQLSLTKQRSPKWKTVRKNFLQKNQECAICGKTENLVPHHKLPFHMFPDKELDEENLVTLCENHPVNCHYLFGHLMNWQTYNPNIDDDVKIWSEKLKNRSGIK